MALDSANKRFAMLNSRAAGSPIVLPVPDGSIDADDRFFFLGLNPIALSAGVGTEGVMDVVSCTRITVFA